MLLEHVARARRRPPRTSAAIAIAESPSRRLAEDARHAEAAVFGRGRRRQHLVAVEARAGHIGAEHVDERQRVRGRRHAGRVERATPAPRGRGSRASSPVSASTSSSVSARRASCATCSTSARVMMRRTVTTRQALAVGIELAERERPPLVRAPASSRDRGRCSRPGTRAGTCRTRCRARAR